MRHEDEKRTARWMGADLIAQQIIRDALASGFALHRRVRIIRDVCEWTGISLDALRESGLR